MNGTLLDTSVLVDVIGGDPAWEGWSTDAIIVAMARGPVYVNQIIMAEVAGGFARVEDFEESFSDPAIERASLPWEAAFLASRAFREYRRRGGGRTSPMPDFYIGAHAALADLAVLTRVPVRFRSYFPTITVISPGEA